MIKILHWTGNKYEEIKFTDIPLNKNFMVKLMERHGSETFYKLLEEMAEIHDKKSHDYASNSNPFGNYYFAGQMALLFTHNSQDAGFVGRIAEKIFRLANLEGKGILPLNESIEDTERDIATIVALWIASRRDRRKLEDK